MKEWRDRQQRCRPVHQISLLAPANVLGRMKMLGDLEMRNSRAMPTTLRDVLNESMLESSDY